MEIDTHAFSPPALPPNPRCHPVPPEKAGVVRAGRGFPARSFAPLTPILASPLITPAVALHSNPHYSASVVLQVGSPPNTIIGMSTAGSSYAHQTSTRLLRPKPTSQYAKPDSQLLNTLPSLAQEPQPPLKVRRARKLDFPTRESLDSLSLTAIHLEQARSHLEHFNVTPRVHSSECANDSQQGKQSDTIRRYHALMELLRTEAKYLLDLRTLVTIYLQNLPTAMTTFRSTTTSYFGASSMANAVTKALPSTTPSAFGVPIVPLSDTPTSAPVIVKRRSRSIIDGKELDNERCSLFSEEEVALLSRNAEDLLSLHDRFVVQLQDVVAPFGSLFSFGSKDDGNYLEFPTDDCLDRVIIAVMSQFAEQSTSFDVYQSFCSTHTEACSLIQSKQKQHPIEWAIWENGCRRTVEKMHRTGSAGHARPNSSSSRGSAESKRPTSSASYVLVPNCPPTSFGGTQKQSSRLGFTDYLIMPVQRICRYNLLLSQLQTKRSSLEKSAEEMRHSSHPILTPNFLSTSSQADHLVTMATNAMRVVVDSVNDDRRRHEYQSKTMLVASRISTSLLPLEFVQSLGACLLVGALDVVYHRPTSSNATKAKYLGTFLYADGYLVLTKVAKTKVYDPMHWFSLIGFEVVDQEDDDPNFPYSFHLTGKGHHFQLAAACHKEKQAWIEGLKEAINSARELEPISSLRDEHREEVITNVLPPQEYTLQTPPSFPPLPTIESLSDVEGGLNIQTPRILTKPQSSKRPKTPMRISFDRAPSIREDPTVKEVGSSLSRSSSASVKAIFSPFMFESGTRVSRSSSLHRQQVDQGLADVFSDLCRDARSLAGIHSIELFQVPKRIPVLPQSTSSMTAAGVLRPKHESKLVARRSYGGARSATVTDRNPRKQKTISDLSCTGTWSVSDGGSSPWSESIALPSPGISPDYTANPLSGCSSEETSGGSALNSPAELEFPHPHPLLYTEARFTPQARPGSSSGSDLAPSRSSSVAGSFRSFFSTRSSLHPTDAHPLSAPSPPNLDWTNDVPNCIIFGGPKRQRTQSTPSSSNSVHKPAQRNTHTRTNVIHGQQDESKILSSHKTPSFHPYTRHDSSSRTLDSTGHIQRKSLRNFLHHFRTYSFTPSST